MLTQDFQKELMHVLTRDFRAKGFSFLTANGLAMDHIERRKGGSMDWRASFAPAANDERLLRGTVAAKGPQ